jgi:hypothetical protein
MSSAFRAALRVVAFVAAALLTLLGGTVLGEVVAGRGTGAGGVVGGVILLIGLGLGYVAFASRPSRPEA